MQWHYKNSKFTVKRCDMMTRPPNKQLPFSSSSSLLFLIVALPLIIISVLVVFTVVPQGSFWSSLPSSATWRLGFFTSYPLASFSPPQAPAPSNFTIFNNNGSYSNQLGHEQETLNVKGHDIAVNGTVKVVKGYNRLEKMEASLARVRSSIREAARVRNLTSVHEDEDYVPRGPIYRNANAFHRSYLEMEKIFKIYVYEEGEPPMFHDGPCKSIYSSEGTFIHELEKGKSYRTKDPQEALVYFLPFSVVMMVEYLYVPNSHETHAIGRAVVDYISVISYKYPFWNRSLGADHFMLTCHDWGPSTSSYVPHLFNNSIRVLCNANTSEGFNPSKDVSFPEIHLKTGEITRGLIGGLSPSRRPILAFFAGRLHGHIRLLLLEQWKNKDKDIQVYDQLPKNVSYESMFKKSRYCLCPSGYEVASPRVVEAIYSECVPVLISENYVLPFSDVLNWKAFSVQVEVKDIPKIKDILMGISQRQYLRMQRRVKQVQRHFLVNGPPKRFDVFHMIIHSIWLRRLNIRIQDFNSN